jgi:phosphoenolpyruvate-protein kinase (PTS system EI component)
VILNAYKTVSKGDNLSLYCKKEKIVYDGSKSHKERYKERKKERKKEIKKERKEERKMKLILAT